MSSESHVPLSYPNPTFAQMADSGRLCDAPPENRMQEGGDNGDVRLRTGESISKTRRAALIVALLMGLLFSTLDTSIVSTSLVTISHDFRDFVNAPWIVLAYMLTYMGFSVCMSKLSDIYGRRNMLVASWVIFVGFSLGCGSAKDMVALIICRAFQGIGASGLYSLTQIGLVDVGPTHNPSLVGAMIGATLAVAFVLGPLIGGAVAGLSDWRWLFNMNIPFGLMTILVITNLWPEEDAAAHIFSWQAFKSIDFIGSATLLCGSGFLVFALQQAGSQTFSWSSAEIISSLIISVICWAGFVWWEVSLQRRSQRHVEPIFPIGLMLRRVYSAGLFITLLTGFPYIALCIVIPERFQIVNGQGALMAGVHLLPLLGACALGSFMGAAISSKRNNTSLTLVTASCLQLIGVSLLMLASDIDASIASQYGYQAIFGLGVGLSFSAATIMTNILASEPNERASAQGAVAQARVLGGCMGLSICTIIFNIHVNQYLPEHLSRTELEDLHRTPLSGLVLPPEQRQLVKEVYAGAFAEEVKVMSVVCAAMVVISLFTLERRPLPLERLTAPEKEDAASRRGSDSGTELNDITSVHNSV